MSGYKDESISLTDPVQGIWDQKYSPGTGDEGGGAGTAFLASTIDVAKDVVGGAEWVGERLGVHPKWLESIREGIGGYTEGMRETIAPNKMRAMNAGFLPDKDNPDIWDADISKFDAMMMKLAGTAPSSLATMGAAMFTGGLGGLVVGGLTEAGNSYDEIRKSVDKFESTPDQKLRDINEMYDGLRNKGFS